MGGYPTGDQVKNIILKRQILRIRGFESDIANALIEDKSFCSGKHLRGNIGSDDMADVRRKLECRMPATRGDIQHQPTGLRTGYFNQTIQIVSPSMRLAGDVLISKPGETFL